MIRVRIDPGHGGKDAGAVSNGLQEKEIVLNIAKGIQTQLNDRYEDILVTLSRNADTYVDLKERTDQANRDDVDALVSIHCNAGGGSGGFETFRYTVASSKSLTLQDAIHTETMSALKPFGVIDRGQKTKNLHMIRESKMPAVLTENLFVDVLSDAGRLKQSEVIQSIINGHVTGIAKYFGISKKEKEKIAIDRDINVVSPWAKSAWQEAVVNGYFDGTRPGAPMTREEMAVVLSRLSKE